MQSYHQVPSRGGVKKKVGKAMVKPKVSPMAKPSVPMGMLNRGR